MIAIPAVVATGLALVATKAADCVTTAKYVVPAGAESNPLARWLMDKLGPYRTVWLVFVVCCAWTIAATAAVVSVLLSDLSLWVRVVLSIGFILDGVTVAYIQWWAAEVNRSAGG
jgi:hypothetical protein